MVALGDEEESDVRRLPVFLTATVLAAGLLLPTLVLGASQSGPFDDVPDPHNFARDVEWLAESGITHGCNPPENSLFCPDDPVTRGQMAAFLVRALHLTAEGPSFDDTQGHLFERDISRLAAAGITRGCNPPENTMFCPDEAVTRGQMAAFLGRGLELPSASDQGFFDTDGVFHDDVNRIAAAGITVGCNPPDNSEFCPDDVVTRGQMAAFLHRGLERDDGEFAPFTISGSGNDVVGFRIPGDVAALVDITYTGTDFFNVDSLDRDHGYIENLAFALDSYQGRRMVHGGWFGEPEVVRHLEIDADDGNWSITARPMSAARQFGTSLRGSGDEIVIYAGSSPTMTSTHNGDSIFAITGYFGTGEYNDLIVLEDGSYSGTDVIDLGIEILDIEADGNWTLATP
ncbi:MAG: hypothetical protein GEU79_09055 [Acidimicrobiia bacterium]|nr:hypothetical protein [Acidimicrobiia bacterium]